MLEVNLINFCLCRYIVDDNDFDIKSGVTEIRNNSVDENCASFLTSGFVICCKMCGADCIYRSVYGWGIGLLVL